MSYTPIPVSIRTLPMRTPPIPPNSIESPPPGPIWPTCARAGRPHTVSPRPTAPSGDSALTPQTIHLSFKHGAASHTPLTVGTHTPRQRWSIRLQDTSTKFILPVSWPRGTLTRPRLDCSPFWPQHQVSDCDSGPRPKQLVVNLGTYSVV
ncbi:hypothetical protein BDV29DRAFT_144350 [Aspergillus leporis]|jgi:hypothetical protein|uniref:Uncharacterized protein n=1 Tax=Aspergillus leporis TaxID=41062 RepID=A0A5N5WWJ2_9EURO|nr:hypothetical protein BDV29DRAFT_144350 [Aspergillus leporis]